MQVDICVLTAGRWDMLETCLANLKNEIDCTPEHKFKVYAYDNGSSREDYQNHRHLFPLSWITHQHSSTNVGFPRGANAVIHMGSSALVLFITDDVFVQPGFLRNSIEKMVEMKDVGVMGFKLVFPSTSTDPHRPAGKVQHVGHGFTIKGEVVHPLVGWSADNPKCCVSRELLSVTGAVMMFRRDVFNRVRGFDEVYGRGTYEDVDICMKIRQAGYKVFLNANAVAQHFTGATATQLQLPFPLHENRQTFNNRWLRSGLVQWDEWSFW